MINVFLMALSIFLTTFTVSLGVACTVGFLVAGATNVTDDSGSTDDSETTGDPETTLDNMPDNTGTTGDPEMTPDNVPDNTNTTTSADKADDADTTATLHAEADVQTAKPPTIRRRPKKTQTSNQPTSVTPPPVLHNDETSSMTIHEDLTEQRRHSIGL